jgi:hypothetical protein
MGSRGCSERPREHFQRPVGTVISEPLTLRERCNKVIHAKRIAFDIERESAWYNRYLNSTLYLYGEQRGENL